jgi:P4 family phage/plasmid primase-like protien
MNRKIIVKLSQNEPDIIKIEDVLLSRLLNQKIGAKISTKIFYEVYDDYLCAQALANGLILRVDEKTPKNDSKVPDKFVKRLESNYSVSFVSDFFNPEQFAKDFIDINPLFYDDSKKDFYLWDYRTLSYKSINIEKLRLLVTNSLNKVKSRYNKELKKANDSDDSKKIVYYNKMLDKINLGKASVYNEFFYYLEEEGLRRFLNLERPEWYEVQCGSKLYNIKNGSFRSVNHSMLVKNPIVWEAIEGQTPTIDALFNEWSPDDKGLLLQMCAYAIVPKYFLKKVFWLLGGGNNGKSTFFKFLTNFVGQSNITTSDLSNLELNRFETSGLIDKLVCVVNEVDHKTLWNNRIIKTISGGDLVRVEEKNRPSYQVEVYSKIIILANDLPKRADYSDAFMSRFVGIIFPKTFEQGENPVNSIPPQEYCAFAYKCLFEVLMTSPKNKGLFQSRSIQGEKPLPQKIIEYDSRSDPLSVFVDTFVEETENHLDFISRQVFYAQYRDYCLKNKLKIETIKKCYSRLRNEFNFKEGRANLSSDEKERPYCFVFVKWKNINEESLKQRVYDFINERKSANRTDLVEAFGEKVDTVIQLMLKHGDLMKTPSGGFICL